MKPMFLPGVEGNPQPRPYRDLIRTMQASGAEYPQIWHLFVETYGSQKSRSSDVSYRLHPVNGVSIDGIIQGSMINRLRNSGPQIWSTVTPTLRAPAPALA
jgi:hypothetical protein